jgi:hypothetical protein
MLSQRQGSVATRLITSLKVAEVLSGATDIETICALSQTGVRIQSIGHLHAKVYLVDADQVLVTSANPTHSGWYSNLEIGLAVQSRTVAEQILKTLGAAQPYTWSQQQLERYAHWVAGQAKVIPSYRSLPSEVLSGAFVGWLRLAMEGVGQLPEEFTLVEAYQKILPVAAQQYPNNKHPKDKIRQQLQGLRDLGVLEFVSPGRYRRLQAIELF